MSDRYYDTGQLGVICHFRSPAAARVQTIQIKTRVGEEVDAMDVKELRQRLGMDKEPYQGGENHLRRGCPNRDKEKICF